MYDATRVDMEAFVPAALVKAAVAENAKPSRLAVELGIAVAGQPTAVLFRQVATPNFETLWFLKKATRLGFHPVIVEYHADQFSVHNPYKRSLAALPVVEKRNIHGTAIVRRHHLLDIERSDRQPLRDLVLPSGEPLIAFHRRLLTDVAKAVEFRTADLSSWFRQHKGGASSYYPDFLSLFSGNVVLFEDFTTNRAEADFFNRVVHPAYGKACAKLGHRPLITRLFAMPHRATNPLCYAYPAFAADAVVASKSGLK